MTDKELFKKQNDELFEFIIFNKFISEMKKEQNTTNVELFISPECNQKCEYCYLIKNEDFLYPKEIRNHDNILKNLKIILDFIYNNDLHLHNLDLFSGEIWHTKFGNQILTILLEYAQKGIKIDSIIIPSNCSFILNDKATIKMQIFFDEFAKTNTRLHISASIDGAIIENSTRSFNDTKLNKEKNETFYKKFFNFVDKNNLGLHPMVSAAGIESWIENLDWWEQEVNKIHRPLSSIMTLEVRNDEWTKEKIQEYLKFLNYCCNKYIVEPGVSKYFDNYFLNPLSEKHYQIENLHVNYKKSMSCSISRTLCIRLGDLMIVPCHRLAYDHLNYGKILVENDKIIGVEANNIPFANKIWLGSCKSVLKCDNCAFKPFCMQGCLGCQYENNKDPLLPCDSVCNFIQAKIIFLIEKYKTIGLYDLIINSKTSKMNNLAFYIQELEKTEDYKTWKTFVTPLIKN